MNIYILYIFFPGGTSGKEHFFLCRRHERHRFDPWVWKIHWRRPWQLIPVFLPGESHGQRNLAGYSLQGHKELDTTEATLHVCTRTHTHTYIYDCQNLKFSMIPMWCVGTLKFEHPTPHRSGP